MDRQVTLTLDLPHIRESLQLNNDLVFRLRFDEVKALLVTVFLHWPGGYEAPPSGSRVEQEAAIAAFRAKGREESIAPQQMDAVLAVDGLSVLSASLLENPDERTLQIRGTADEDERLYTLVVRAARVVVERSDGVETSLAELRTAREAFWENR
jgi:hypothetical protein